MEDKILELLQAYKAQEISSSAVVQEIKNLTCGELGFANLDYNRATRQGFAEVVYCEGKTSEQIALIMEKLSLVNANILGTRATKDNYLQVQKKVPTAKFNEMARTITIIQDVVIRKPEKKILVISAGTSDMPIAEEAVVTAEIMGNRVERLYDVGVAGIQRLLKKLDRLDEANVIIVVAGMEGALASVVGGLVNKPVIAVPTSVGYGANFQGLSALLGMLNSCSAGIAVVNIDNGFGAGRLASIINNME